MSKTMIKIVNASTGKEVEREMNEQELAQWELEKAESLAREERLAAKESARENALDKLTALGLTPEEISAITGA
jgi:adenine-specific DNA methylase